MVSATLDRSAARSAPNESRPLRLCHVSLTLKTGGLERILCDLARFHDRRAFQPTFLALREVGFFADQIRAAGCDVVQLRERGRLSELRAMSRFFRQGRFDIVHLHNTYPHIYGSLAARWAKVPVVVSTRHGQRAGHRWHATWQYACAAHLVDRVIAVSDDAARLCVAADGLPASKVCRIWNGIDCEAFAYQGPVAAPVAISVARLSPEKDFATLLQGIALAALHVPALRLRIVGDGPERAALERLAGTLGLGERVEFLGERQDVAALLGEAAFFVSTSLTEGISLTLLEAMAVGLPVIATSVGGNPEVVVEGVTGHLCPPRAPQAFADAVVRLCRAPERWAEYGRAGRERVRSCFDVRRLVAEYEDLYHHLIAEQSSNRLRGRSLCDT
jgi:glycosyltransferase involved in cell wall biosynthesis